jgi:poly(A) polymerase
MHQKSNHPNSENVPQDAIAVVKRLSEAGHIAYFAGGFVRDFIMQQPSDDIDIATSASVEEVQALFDKTIPVGISFGIVIVVHGSHQFEVATFRKEFGYFDGRRPTRVEKATPEEDALRRDFTINGMFWDPIEKKLYDYVGGQEDIQRKVIRAIGNPHERFYEDRLRMMRAVRYATRFNFSIEEQTYSAIREHAHALLPSVAMERIWQEFKKMAQFGHFDTSLCILHTLGLLAVIFPNLKNVSVEEMQRRTCSLAHFPKEAPAIAQLLEIFPNASLDDLLVLSESLKLSKQDKDLTEFLYHARTLFEMPAEWLEKMEKIEWARFYAHPYCDLALAIHAAHLPLQQRSVFTIQHETLRRALARFIARITHKQPLVDAQTLMDEGIRPGKQMGLLLAEAERISVNEEIEEKSVLIALLKKTIYWQNGPVK